MNITKLSVALAISLASFPAAAANLNWENGSHFYDVGIEPSVAVGWNGQGGLFQMEVHTGGTNNIWYHSAQPYEQLGLAAPFGTGTSATIALGDPSNLIGMRIGSFSSGQMFYDLYPLTIGAAPSSHALNEVGWFPSVAVRGGFSAAFTPILLEVHQGQAAAGSLWEGVGFPTIDPGTGAWTSITTWAIHPYDTGALPAISMMPLTATTFFVIEVHQLQFGNTSPLVSNAGILTLQPNHDWTFHSVDQEYFTTGANASVAICVPPVDEGTRNIYVVQVNEGTQADLWSHTGIFTPTSDWSSGTFHWISGSDQHYDNGFSPKVSCHLQPVGGSTNPERGLEVHEAQPGVDQALWYHGFSVTSH